MKREEELAFTSAIFRAYVFDHGPAEGGVGADVVDSMVRRPVGPSFVIEGVLIGIKNVVGATSEGEERLVIVSKIDLFRADLGKLDWRTSAP